MIGVIPNLNKTSIWGPRHITSTVDIYILPVCACSKRAFKPIDSLNIKYNSHIIITDEEFNKINNITSIFSFPQIFINNQFIGGYSELSNIATKGDLIELIYQGFIYN